MFGQLSEIADNNTEVQSTERLTKVLADANGFSLDALDNNRQGILTSQQRSKLLPG